MYQIENDINDNRSEEENFSIIGIERSDDENHDSSRHRGTSKLVHITLYLVYLSNNTLQF